MIINTTEREALSRAAARAALDECKAMLAHDEEHLRAGFWNRLRESTRIDICEKAGLPKAVGQGALAKISAGDRAKIHAEARRVYRDMEKIMRCTWGGKTQDHGEMAAHSFDGITADKKIQ